MYFFHGRLVNYAVEKFKAGNFDNAADADEFFELFVPGNRVFFAERPFERFSDYEELLWRLREADQEKYQRLHKGTPFYYMSWLAFDLKNYEKALFFIDAAISEDVRKDPAGWRDNPGARFLLLDASAQPAARTVNGILRRVLNDELTRFNSISNQTPLDIQSSWVTFVQKLMIDETQRTIISALYVFLLEFEDCYRELSLSPTFAFLNGKKSIVRGSAQ